MVSCPTYPLIQANPERVVVIEVSANLGAENAEDVIVELGGLMVVPDDDFPATTVQ